MIEQKGPGLPQAACRRLSSSIYLQACAPALPPVWQACPDASSLPSCLSLSPPFSFSFSISALCTGSFSYLYVHLQSLALGSFTPNLCVCVHVVPFEFVHDCKGCSLLAVHAALWENSVKAWHILLKTGRGGARHESFRSGFSRVVVRPGLWVLCCSLPHHWMVSSLFLLPVSPQLASQFVFLSSRSLPLLVSISHVIWRGVPRQNNWHQLLFAALASSDLWMALLVLVSLAAEICFGNQSRLTCCCILARYLFALEQSSPQGSVRVYSKVTGLNGKWKKHGDGGEGSREAVGV